MALKNRSMYAILGILSICPSTGYDIKKYSDKVLSGFWNENFGHIYPTLKRMLDENTIEITSHSCADKRTVYSITEKGRDEFRAWLEEDCVQQPVRSEFLLKLLFSSAQPRQNVVAMLEKHKAEYEKKIKLFQDMERTLLRGIPEVSEDRRRFLYAVLRRGIMSGEAVVNWCEETMASFTPAADGWSINSIK